MLRSNRRLIRKHQRAIIEAAIHEAKRWPVPIYARMWMNYEVVRMGERLLQAAKAESVRLAQKKSGRRKVAA